jgi:hypothetical protein
MDCYEGMRAALRRNIEGLTHLSSDEKDALLEHECSAAISATEAGRPLVDIFGPDEAANDAGDVEEGTLRAAKIRKAKN